MKIKSETSGHGHHKGMVQFRWSFFLKNGDYRYAEFGSNTPCHDHFMYLEPTVTDSQIDALRDTLLDQFEPRWNADQLPYLSNANVPFWGYVPQERLDACNAKANDLKTKNFEKEKNGK